MSRQAIIRVSISLVLVMVVITAMIVQTNVSKAANLYVAPELVEVVGPTGGTASFSPTTSSCGSLLPPGVLPTGWSTVQANYINVDIIIPAGTAAGDYEIWIYYVGCSNAFSTTEKVTVRVLETEPTPTPTPTPLPPTAEELLAQLTIEYDALVLTHAEEIATLESTIAGLEATIELLEDTITGQIAQLEVLQRTNDSQDIELIYLQAAIDELEDDIADLETQLAEITALYYSMPQIARSANGNGRGR